MSEAFTESVVEEAALDWFSDLGYEVKYGAMVAPGESDEERKSFDEVILDGRLRWALKSLNPQLSPEEIDEAVRKINRTDQTSLVGNNHTFHRILVDGVTIEVRKDDGRIAGEQARIIDFDEPANNDWLVLNQFTVIEDKNHRRPDIVVFVNGLPLVVIELKNAADENATVWSAFQQLQTYKKEIPSLFVFNEALLISDGVQSRLGSLTADRERFMPWKTVDGQTLADNALSQLKVMIEGVFEKRRFLDLLRYFVVFEDEGGGKLIKKLAGYHQYHAVNVALEETLRASRTARAEHQLRERPGVSKARDAKPGDRRIGVVWHTQGSGKSLTMAFYAGRVILHPEMKNPTVVVLTDRNDLDGQLYNTFSRCDDLLRQPPTSVDSRADLKMKLNVDSGGVFFTTIQKFFPEEKGGQFPVLSERENIVVIADEAHRSQYDFIDGYARHMRDALPNASFIGFTGTPIELTDKNTRAVFGDYISVYDIQRAVQDGATVPIYYESRLAKLELKESQRPHLDSEFEEVTESEEQEIREDLKTKWAQLEALVGTEERIRLIAQDFVNHFEKRLDVMDGKAMIVGMSRRICIDLYKAIVALRPAWKSDDDTKGIIKVVMTGAASDPDDWQPHIRNKRKRDELAERFRKSDDEFKIAIVRDMWLTGFDAPSLHTIYVDKPMRGHGLMQAIARVNRVFKDKPGGLVVDYLGLADQLRDALAVYTESGGKGDTAIDQQKAVDLLIEKYEMCCGLFHGFEWSKWKTGKPGERLSLLPAAQEHVLQQKDGKERLLRIVKDLTQTFALAVPHPKAMGLRDDVGFFQAVRSVLAKGVVEDQKPREEMDLAIRQIISNAIASNEVVDIFSAAGLKKPDISILDEKFLAEVRSLPQKHLAVELLRKLLLGEIKSRSKKNAVQARSFSDMLEQAIKRYQARAIETAQVIEELIKLAKDINKATKKGKDLGLSEDEVAFYDALETNDSAVKVLGDETLRNIARELVTTVKKNTVIDWAVRENVRANLRVIVKRILRKYGYPPDKQEKATETVLEQAELFSGEWAAAT